MSHTSKTQRVVSLSTSEAEYIAAGEGVKEALFVHAVLSFIAPETSGASIKVVEDNQGAKSPIENPLSSARSKHRATSCLGAPGAQALDMRRVPAHRTRR